MANISEKVLEKIKEEKIIPKPRWQFLLKNYVLWTIFGASIIVGSLSLAVILHTTFENDWDIYRYLDKSLLEYILISLPYFWIILLAILLAVAYYDYRHTKTGYRYRYYWIVLGSILVSFILGLGFLRLGMGKEIDEVFTRHVPYYSGTLKHKKEIWSHPEKGLLAGRIKIIIDDKDFNLEDFRGKVWEVRESNIVWREAPRIEEEVKLIGEKSDNCCIFFVKEIRSWVGKKIKGVEPDDKNEDGQK
jgi:hypothetical protein